MATITLAADTNYSALTVANDDTIDCAGFILTLDVAPTETGVQVTSPATNGRVVFDGGWNLGTWDFFAGESTSVVGMITTLPEGATINSITGGTSANARGIITSNGTVTTAQGGSGSGSQGILTSNGTVTTAQGGSGFGARGVDTNNGEVTDAFCSLTINAPGVGTNNGSVGSATGGAGNSTFGVTTNNGTVDHAIGKTGNNGCGVGTNNGTVILAEGTSSVGSPNAGGVSVNNGLVLKLTDSVGLAVRTWNGSRTFVLGPDVNGTIAAPIKTIYSLGALSASATIAGDADVIEVSKGKGLTGIR